MEQILLDMLTLYVAEVTGGMGAERAHADFERLYIQRYILGRTLYPKNFVGMVNNLGETKRKGGGRGWEGNPPPPLPAPARSEKTKKAWSE